jgi:hypothetical protein
LNYKLIYTKVETITRVTPSKTIGEATEELLMNANRWVLNKLPKGSMKYYGEMDGLDGMKKGSETMKEIGGYYDKAGTYFPPAKIITKPLAIGFKVMGELTEAIYDYEKGQIYTAGAKATKTIGTPVAEHFGEKGIDYVAKKFVGKIEKKYNIVVSEKVIEKAKSKSKESLKELIDYGTDKLIEKGKESDTKKQSPKIEER